MAPSGAPRLGHGSAPSLAPNSRPRTAAAPPQGLSPPHTHPGSPDLQEMMYDYQDQDQDPEQEKDPVLEQEEEEQEEKAAERRRQEEGQIREGEERDWDLTDRPEKPDSYLVEAASRAKPSGLKDLIPDKEALDNSELFCGYSIKELRDLQAADPELRIVRHWVKDNQAPTRKQMQNARASRDLWAYLQHLKSIRLENGLLVMDRLSSDPPSPTRDTRLLLPQGARLRVTAAHHEMCCGHLGSDYTCRSIQTWCYWPGLISQVSCYVSTCQRCRQKRFPAKPVKPSNRFIKTSGFVGETNSIDLIGPFPPGPHNENFCLTSIDLFSKYLIVVPIVGKTAQAVATAFTDYVVANGANVVTVHSDNGKEFKNNLFKKVTSLLQIRHTFSLPYHPLGNASIESAHFRIKTILRASLGRQPTSVWTAAVRGAARTLNSMENDSSGLTPNFLFYGRETALPLASFVTPPRPDNHHLTPQERAVQISQQSVKYLTQHRLGLEVLQRRRVHLGNMNHPLYPLTAHVGQSVMICDSSELRNHPNRSLAPRWSGPHILISAVNNVVGVLRSDFKHHLGLPETRKLLGIDRLLPIPKGLRWENINTLSSFSKEARDSLLEENWSSLDLFAEYLEGADPGPRLHQLGMDPSEVNLSYEEALWDGQSADEGHEEGGDDPQEDEDDQPPGGGGLGDGAAPHVDEPGPRHFRPGVGLDIQDDSSSPPPAHASLPGVEPPPPLPPRPPSPSLESGEARHRQEDRTFLLPDGSQFQVSRRSSRSRISRPPARFREYKVEDSSGEDDDEPSSDDDDDEAPGPVYTPLSGPSPYRRDQSPPPDPSTPREPGTQGHLEHSGDPGRSGDTPDRNRGLGHRLSKVKKRLREHWIVGKPTTPSANSDRPALPSPRPVDHTPNLTPIVPVRLEEQGQALSLDTGPRGAGPIRLRSPEEPAASQDPPARDRRSRQPPARYQSEDFTPAHKVKKEGKGSHKRKEQ